MPAIIEFKGSQAPKTITLEYLAQLKIRTQRYDAGLDPEPPAGPAEEAFQTSAFQANAVQ